MLDSFSFYLVNDEMKFWTGTAFSADGAQAKPYRNRVVCCSVITALAKRGIVAKYDDGESLNNARLSQIEADLGDKNGFIIVHRDGKMAWTAPRGTSIQGATNWYTSNPREAYVYVSQKAAQNTINKYRKQGFYGMGGCEVMRLSDFVRLVSR